jgi:hypothetical protein
MFLQTENHWLNLIHKQGLIQQYAALGFSDPALTATIVGCLEIAAAFWVVFKPSAPLLLLLFTWKMGSEMFYQHFGFIEWFERGGSYACLLALLLVKVSYRNPALMPSNTSCPGHKSASVRAFSGFFTVLSIVCNSGLFRSM